MSHNMCYHYLLTWLSCCSTKQVIGLIQQTCKCKLQVIKAYRGLALARSTSPFDLMKASYKLSVYSPYIR